MGSTMRVILTAITCMYLIYMTDTTRTSGIQSPFNLNCDMHFVQLRVRHKNCVPIKLRARACSGACSSYTKVSTSQPWQLEQTCNCCQYAGRKRKLFGIRCPHKRGKRGFRVIVMSVLLPRGCRCRPCSTEPNAIVAPEATMFNKSPIVVQV